MGYALIVVGLVAFSLLLIYKVMYQLISTRQGLLMILLGVLIPTIAATIQSFLPESQRLIGNVSIRLLVTICTYPILTVVLLILKNPGTEIRKEWEKPE
jgi:predicted Co/Zn/Cd cation transporter (cation efflux family)